MDSAGHLERGDQPRRPSFVKVGNQPVVIDSMTLYPHEPHHEGTYHPDGLQFRKKVKGTLTEWAITDQGGGSAR